MHACGHDNHRPILLGAATALARMKDRLPGTVKVIFQPGEEGLPPGEVGGAEQMFVFLGVTPRDQDHTTAPQNHSPLFFADESALPVGIRVMTNLALDCLFGGR